LTEEESEIYDLMGLLLRRGGIIAGISILVGALLVLIGLQMLPWGSIAVTIGILMMIYGISRIKKKAQQRTH
jgi:uncharacterized membrane protein